MHILLTLLIGCLISIASAQTTSFTLKIKNTRNRPIPNVLVWAFNEESGNRISAQTNNNGEAFFFLKELGNYSFSFLEMKDIASAEVKSGVTGKFMRSITYDPEGILKKQPNADRSKIVFTTVSGEKLRGQSNVAKFIIHVKNRTGSRVSNIHVEMVSIQNKIKYSGFSNSYGQATFYVPKNATYEIDVAQIEGFKKVKIPNYSGLTMQEVVFYEKTHVKETIKGDTIVQHLINHKKGSSSHVLFSLNLKDFNGNALEKEPVFLKDLNSNRVYEGMTNAHGKCSLMLKKGTDYVLNLKYENGLLLVEAPNSIGFRTESATRRYRGSAIIEKQIAAQKADMEELKERLKKAEEHFASGQAESEVTFAETPVERITAPKNYIESTNSGFNIDFNSAGPTATPTVIDDRLYTQEGLYSSNYYCLDANDGSFQWGLELGESGISPAVYQNGVLLINTASCTLYAIDAKTGELLWSKWLAGYIYTTPSADDNNVFVAYNHGGYPVVVSFDLRTGKLNWMRLVDEEIIACPILESDEVHVASQKGMYYIFDKQTGKLKQKRTDLNAVSSPTIAGDLIYITISNKGQEYLTVLHRMTLKTEMNYPTSLNSLKISGRRNVDLTDQMNFNGSHPIVYKDKIAIVTDANTIIAYSIGSENELWRKSIQTNPDQIPIVANESVILTSNDGKIMSYDMVTGDSKFIQKIDGKIQGQPVQNRGFLYIAVGGIVSVIKSKSNHSWQQWNKNGSHNTIWD